MKQAVSQIDPETICEVDKAKLIAHMAAFAQTMFSPDDPRRDCITAEMLDIGLAPSPDSTIDIIAWWDPVVANLKPIVASIRRSFGRMKLVGRYGAT